MDYILHRVLYITLLTACFRNMCLLVV